MVLARSGWRHWLCGIVLLLAALSPARGQDDLTLEQLALIGPPDLSSPRDTLAVLQGSVAEAYRVFGAAYDQYRAEPGWWPSPAVEARIDTVNLLLRRAMATFDLSAVPPVNRNQSGIEAALLLGEVFNRLPPIDLETVPDAAAVRESGITAWRLPNTNLVIARMEQGPRAGEFMFTAGSVVAARELYDAISLYGGRLQSGADLYRFYTLTPGDLLPPKYLLWIEDLPIWMRVPAFLDQSAWQWTGVALTIVLLFGGWWLVLRGLRRRSAARGERPGFVVRIAAPVLLALVAVLAQRVIVDGINVSGGVLHVAANVLEGIAYLAVAWAAYLICVGIGETVAGSSRIDRASLDASFIRVMSRVLGIAVVIALVFIGATEIGLPVYGVIAGLGVGGLALGLAARPTLENLIGGFVLYADRPVRVGEFCKFGDKLGTIEEIGLRSTRIRALDRTVVTVPNADFANMQIVNMSRRDQTLLDVTIGLRHDTTAAQLHAILAGIEDLLRADPDVVDDTVRVRFQEFGTFFLGIGIRAHVAKTHSSAFLEVQERILFAIMTIVGDAGTELAFMPPLPATVAAGARR
jgi:MscS family membrane protein